MRASFTSAPAPGRTVVVQEQRLVLDDPAGTQDSGVVATIGAFVPVWSTSYPAGHSTGEPLVVDLYQPVATHTESFLAGMPLTAGPHTVTLVTTTPNPASRDVVDHGVNDHGSSIGMDFVRVTWLGA